MAYTDPPDFGNNTTISSAELNTYLRDNFQSLRDHSDLMCNLRLTSGPLPLANNTSVSISWTTAPRNQGSLWASASNTRIYLPAVGRWRLWGSIGFSSNASAGSRYVYYKRNATAASALAHELQGGAGDMSTDGSGNDKLAIYHNFAVDTFTSSTGDYITFFALQNSGSTMSLSTGNATTVGTQVGVRYLGEWVSAT